MKKIKIIKKITLSNMLVGIPAMILGVGLSNTLSICQKQSIESLTIPINYEYYTPIINGTRGIAYNKDIVICKFPSYTKLENYNHMYIRGRLMLSDWNYNYLYSAYYFKYDVSTVINNTAKMHGIVIGNASGFAQQKIHTYIKTIYLHNQLFLSLLTIIQSKLASVSANGIFSCYSAIFSS